MITGIYKIENLINHKVYIGQSVHIPKRLREHKSGAFNSNNKDYNMVIYQAIRKYGLENFSFEILELCSEKDLNKKEQYWIQYYNSFNNGYNATEGGDNSHIHLGKPVELYDLDGNYVTEYPNITEAAKALGVSRYTIYSILYKQRKSTKGFQFKLKEDKITKIEKYSSRQGNSYIVYKCDDNNNILDIYKSANEAGRQNNLDPSTISKVCRGKLKHHGGFKWIYEKDYMEVKTMKNYTKPTIIVNEELAEGVYMSSGDLGCYTASANIHQRPETGRGDYRIQVNGIHNADHTKEKQWLYITFNMNVTYKSSQGTLVNGDGSNTLCIEYNYHQNPTDNIGLGDLVVEADAGLAVANVKITD